MNKKNIEAIYPLSPSQQGMLFETLANPQSGLYIEQAVLTLTGHIAIEAFQQSWQQMLQRHAALRTCFIWQNRDEPLQVALKNVTLPIESADWRHLDVGQQQTALNKYLHKIQQQGFALNKAPLMRLGLFRTQDDVYQCVWSFHHILMDGWGLSIILKDVLALYTAAQTGTSPTLPPSRPYVEYIRWLRRQDLSSAETFWRDALEGFSVPTSLGRHVIHSSPSQKRNIGSHSDALRRNATSAAPAARDAGVSEIIGPTRSMGPSKEITEESKASESLSEFTEQKMRFSTVTTHALQAAAQQQRMTISTIIQGIWALLLSCYSGQADVVFGATVSGRPPDLSGVETMVGMLINTVPIRLQIDSESSFFECLQILQQQLQARQRYEYCAAGQIRQWCAVPHTLPLYDSIVVFENYPVDFAALTSSGIGFRFTDFRVVGAQTRYPLTLIVVPSEDLSLQLVVNRQYFGDSDVSAILRHVQILTEHALAQPDIPVDRFITAIPEAEIPTIHPPYSISSEREDRSILAPRTETERQLLHLWQEVLEREQISIEDNFFDLGGHSLLATQLASRIRQQFQIELPLHDLFQEPTIAGLARLIDNIRWAAQPQPTSEQMAEEREEGEI